MREKDSKNNLDDVSSGPILSEGQGDDYRASGGVRNINYFLPADDHRKLKIHAVQREMTLQSIMSEALQLYYDKYNLGEVGRAKTYRR